MNIMLGTQHRNEGTKEAKSVFANPTRGLKIRFFPTRGLTILFRLSTLSLFVSSFFYNARITRQLIFGYDPQINATIIEADIAPVLEQIPLYLITPSARPYLLVKAIFHVLPLRRCFDVHWIVVHGGGDNQASQVPLFRNVFPWITEIFTSRPAHDSGVGNHERNVATQHLLTNLTSPNGGGLVYFLDDDNTPSLDLCQDSLSSTLNVGKMYYADQHLCHRRYLKMSRIAQKWAGCNNASETMCPEFSLYHKADTGSFLAPLWLLKQKPVVQWELDRGSGSDGIFWTNMVKKLIAVDGKDRRIEYLPSVKFNYNMLNQRNGCIQWREPWSKQQLSESLEVYRNLTSEMVRSRNSLPSGELKDREQVIFHEYVHILYVLRFFVQRPIATYVELGVWKGGSSLLMSRHPLSTNVIGIDGFFHQGQHNEAEGYRKALQGNGTISWIKGDSKRAVPDLQKKLQGNEIDILFIDGDHSVGGVLADFRLYAPLVAEGGFIVFDDFMDSKMSAGVRIAVMTLIRYGEIDLNSYDIFGSVQNVEGAGLFSLQNESFFDWQSIASNEFVIRKRMLTVNA